MNKRVTRALLIAAASILWAQCGSTSPTGSQTFSGTLQPGEDQRYTFTADRAGLLTATATFPNAVDLGLGVSLTDASCTPALLMNPTPGSTACKPLGIISGTHTLPIVETATLTVTSGQVVAVWVFAETTPKTYTVSIQVAK